MDDTTLGFGVLAKRSRQTTERMITNNTQRRYLVADDVDREYELFQVNATTCEVLVPISMDMCYIERWAFKLLITKADEVTWNSVKITIDGIDLTSAFLVQYPESIDGIGMKPDSTMNNKYDIIKAASILNASERSVLLKQGYHKIAISANKPISGRLRVSQKFSYINRQG